MEITGWLGVGNAPSGLIGQKRIIADYAGAAGGFIATLVNDWDTQPDADTQYSLYKRTYDLESDIGFSPLTDLWAIERMEKASDGSPVYFKEWQEMLNLDRTATGNPGSYTRYGNELLFDNTPNEVQMYRAYIYRFPTKFAAVDMGVQTSVIPEFWHELIILGAVYRGFSKLMEPDREEKALEDYIVCMGRKRTTQEIESPNTTRGLKVRKE
jgi:hypothetical protein